MNEFNIFGLRQNKVDIYSLFAEFVKLLNDLKNNVYPCFLTWKWLNLEF